MSENLAESQVEEAYVSRPAKPLRQGGLGDGKRKDLRFANDLFFAAFPPSINPD